MQRQRVNPSMIKQSKYQLTSMKYKSKKKKQTDQQGSEQKSESKELILVSHADKNEVEKVTERILPLTVQDKHQLEFFNKNKHELNDEDLERNIDKVLLEGDLSPKKIDTINVAWERKYKKGKNTWATTMQTKSHSKQKLG